LLKVPRSESFFKSANVLYVYVCVCTRRRRLERKGPGRERDGEGECKHDERKKEIMEVELSAKAGSRAFFWRVRLFVYCYMHDEK